MENEKLQHHGILGMKWGIRRYQNPDGSLTPAGRKRAQKLKGEYKELTGKKLKGKLPKVDPNSKKIHDLTDEELTNKVKRLRSEKEAHQLERDLSGNGSKFVRSVGKDVVAPASIEAGKNLLSKLLYEAGAKATGLKKSEYDSGMKELKKSTEIAELKNRKYKAETELKNRMAKEMESQKKSEANTIADIVGPKGKPMTQAQYNEYKKKGKSWFTEIYGDIT